MRQVDKDFFDREYNKWTDQTDYKNMDYYQYKDAVANKHFETDNGQKSLMLEWTLRDKIAKEAKKSKEATKKYIILPYKERKYTDVILDDYRDIEYGKEVVHQLMMDINYGN